MSLILIQGSIAAQVMKAMTYQKLGDDMVIIRAQMAL